MEGGDDEDIEVTTDEPAEDDATELLRQIYDLIKPEIEGDEEPEMDMEEPEEEEGEEEEDEEEGDEEEEELDEAVDNHTFFRADNVARVNPKAKDVQGTREKMNEGAIRRKNDNEFISRFQRLANIQK